MLLADLVTTAGTVAATRSRTQKTAALADLLRRLAPDEIEPGVGLLVGRLRQGRVGVGWHGMSEALGAPAAVATLTIGDVDHALEALAALGGAGSSAERTTALATLFARATAQEHEYLARAILGEVRTGALDGVLTDAIATAAGVSTADVRRAAMLSGDLGETARLALTGADLGSVGLVVGRPVQPMLAATAVTATAAIAAIGEASVEYKLDGARVQVHRVGDDVHVFTRTLADITHRLPNVVAIVRGMPVRDVILDGEVLLFGEDDAPRPFQETMAQFGTEGASRTADSASRTAEGASRTAEGASRTAVLRPWFFDILHVDGRDLIAEPLSVRRAELLRVAGEHTVPGVVTADPDVAERVSREALDAGHEGVVVKAISSPYAAGRRGANWAKVKPVHTYDLVVLAAEWGYGRRAGLLSNLHLGARDPDGAFGERGGFVMVGKTFKGLTDALLRWQTERFQELEVRRTGTDRGGTVWIAPEVVVEIAIDGVQRSTRYPGGVALRFARVKRYRDDKHVEDADTIDALRGLLRA
jgi:DNA ligase-1